MCLQWRTKIAQCFVSIKATQTDEVLLSALCSLHISYFNNFLCVGLPKQETIRHPIAKQDFEYCRLGCLQK